MNLFNFFNDRDVVYYGDTFHFARDPAENKVLNNIFNRIKEIFPNIPLNSAMITKYKDGECNLSLHADNEDEIDEENPIISLSLGASRPMIFQDRANKNKLRSVTLQHGDIMLMSGNSQKRCKHCNPACAEKIDTRISITFRCINQNQSRADNTRQTRPRRQTRSASYAAATYSNNRSSSTNPTYTNKRCLILHDSMLNLVEQQALTGPNTKLRSIKTLERMTRTNTRNQLKEDNLLKDSELIVVHLGVNDLKHAPTYLVIEDLKATLLNLAQSSRAKILFSLILPVGDPALNNRIKDFNTEAVQLITDFRKRGYLKHRLYTVYNKEFTEKPYQDIEYLYSDTIHINAEGTSILLKNLHRVIQSVTSRDASINYSQYRNRTT